MKNIKNLIKQYLFSLCLLFNSAASKVCHKDISIKITIQADKSEYLQMHSNPLVSENHYGEYRNNATQMKHGIAYWNNKQNMLLNCYKLYKILYKNKTVGFIELYNDNTDEEVSYIAYSIDPIYWKKGIGTIAVKKIIEHCRSELKKIGVRYIQATVRITNKGSIRVLEKNNFKIIEEKFFVDCPIKVLKLTL